MLFLSTCVLCCVLCAFFSHSFYTLTLTYYPKSFGGVAELVELIVKQHVSQALRLLSLKALSLLLDTRFGVDHFTTAEYIDPEEDLLLLDDEAEHKTVCTFFLNVKLNLSFPRSFRAHVIRERFDSLSLPSQKRTHQLA